jgi:DNA-binding response OmpR family regulator
MSTHTKTILIIEDEKDLQEALHTTLTYEGFEVLTASDGEEGLRVAEESAPDLILLDITMPKLDGIQVLTAMRRTDWGKHMKVIVMTALDDLSKVAEVMDAGGDEYMVKTQVSLSDIVKKVKTRLNI